jgi:hypothetical protein
MTQNKMGQLGILEDIARTSKKSTKRDCGKIEETEYFPSINS